MKSQEVTKAVDYTTAILAGLVFLVLGTNQLPAEANGPRTSSCTAYSNDKVVGNYNCLAGRDANGAINFIQWEDGTASTGLSGWRRSSKNCFASSENPKWMICN